MYTRCPSCRSEISFNPPENAANYPDGYKFRLRCPSCGATISVKIPRQEAYLDAQPIYRTQNPYATSFEPVYNAEGSIQENTDTARKPVSKYKHGRGRSAMMMIFSLLFAALGIFGYLLNAGVVSFPAEVGDILTRIFGGFDGITFWQMLVTDFEGVQIVFALLTPAEAVLVLLPFLIFTLAAIHLIVSFSCLIAGKYSRIYNLVMCVCIGGLSIYFLFAPLVIAGGATELKEYFMSLLSEGNFMPIIIAALGAITLIFSLGFLLNLKKKQPKQN